MPTEVRPTGSPSANIMLVGEAPGEREVEQGVPFVGASGQEMDKMLAEAGIARDACFVTNIARVRPPDNKIKAFFLTKTAAKKTDSPMFLGKYPTKEIMYGVQKLQQEIKVVQPNIIIAFGATSMWALTGLTGKGNDPQPTGIMTWRGSQEMAVENIYGKRKVIPVVHPAAILRQWSYRRDAVLDLKRAAQEQHTSEYKYPDYNFLIRPAYSEVMIRLRHFLRIMNHGIRLKLAVDLETRLRHIACVGIAWSTRNAICIPLMSTENPQGYWTQTEEFYIVWMLLRVLTHPNCDLIGQNFDYDAQYIAREWGAKVLPRRDTMIYQHTNFPGLPKGLDYLSSIYCDFHQYWKDEGKEWDPKTMDEERLWIYNCKDAVVTYEIDTVLQQLTELNGLKDQVDFQMRQVEPVFYMELRGMNQDWDAKRQVTQEMFEYQTQLADFLTYVIPDRVMGQRPKTKSKSAWYDSPSQTAGLFYHTIGLPVQYAQRGKGKRTPSVDDEALTALGNIEPLIKPVTDALKSYRSCSTLIRNVLLAPMDWDRRFRSSINLTGTETFRYSSSRDVFGYGGNNQNLTKGDEEDEPEIQPSVT